MAAIRVTRNYFAGLRNLSNGTGNGTIGDIIRKMAQDNARTRAQSSSLTAFVDNSTGSNAGLTFVDAPLPTSFNAVASGGSLLTSFNTNLSGYQDAFAVIATKLNTARASLGLTALTFTAGTVATPGMIPAVGQTVTTANGATAVDFATGIAAMRVAKNNLRALVEATIEFQLAVGATPVADQLALGTYIKTVAIATIPAAIASTDGTNSVAKASADLFFTAMANDVAKIAQQWSAAATDATVRPLQVIAGY
jgi:hypothetical protein